VIPVLLLKESGLVKTVKFSNARYIGDPLNAVRIFNEKEVDELVVLDIDASLNSVGPNFDLVKELASECFMPLAYGGGISHVDEAVKLFGLGVEKVILRTSAARNLQIVSEIAEVAGESSVAVCVDVDVTKLGIRFLHSPGTKLHKDRDIGSFVKAAERAGAGEILLNSVSRDGTQRGLDLELISSVTACVRIPVVAVGGVGSLGDISDGVQAGASGVGVGSLFVFHGSRRAVLISYPSYDDLRELLGEK